MKALIGVADDGMPRGLTEDYALVKGANRDGYELWLRDLLTQTLGGPAATEVVVRFARVDDCEVCALSVPRSRRPVFLRAPKQQSTEFPVRIGNSTRVLPPHELLDYSRHRFARRFPFVRG